MMVCAFIGQANRRDRLCQFFIWFSHHEEEEKASYDENASTDFIEEFSDALLSIA